MARGVPGIATSRKRLKDAELKDLGLTPLFTKEGIIKDTSMSEVVVERYFPDKLMARGVYRSTEGTAKPIKDNFKLAIPVYGNGALDIWIPKGTSEVCPDTGFNSIKPVERVVGIVEAVDGDNRSKDLILVGYVNMTSTGPVVFDTTFQRVIMEGNSIIKLKDDEISITGDKITFNGDITIIGDVTITGDVTINGEDISTLITLIKAHLGG